jgi:murein tripeptide amidase MpaA
MIWREIAVVRGYEKTALSGFGIEQSREQVARGLADLKCMFDRARGFVEVVETAVENNAVRQQDREGDQQQGWMKEAAYLGHGGRGQSEGADGGRPVRLDWRTISVIC